MSVLGTFEDRTGRLDLAFDFEKRMQAGSRCILQESIILKTFHRQMRFRF
jgi:hypothetical protein